MRARGGLLDLMNELQRNVVLSMRRHSTAASALVRCDSVRVCTLLSLCGVNGARVRCQIRAVAWLLLVAYLEIRFSCILAHLMLDDETIWLFVLHCVMFVLVAPCVLRAFHV